MSKIVKVEIINKDLMDRNGRFHHYNIEAAKLGVEKGIWKIVGDLEEQIIVDQKSRPMESLRPEGYLKKKGFKALTYRDVWGEEKKK